MLDIKGDELAVLGDENSAVTAPGTKKETSLTELQSFVDLMYTHGRSVTSLQWLPHRKVLMYMCILFRRISNHVIVSTVH